jgi:hypothetical protein
MQSACLLLLTACINPGAANDQVRRRDPRVRLKDYVDALRFWLRLGDHRIRHILFVENSGHPLGELEQIVQAERPPEVQVELLHAGNNEIPEGMTYAYPEVRMMDAAVEASHLWHAPPQVIIKATGRFTFPRLPALLDALPEDFAFCGDSMLHRDAFRFWRTPTHMQSMLFLSRKPFFEQVIRKLWTQMRPERGHRILEDVLCRQVRSYASREKILLRFPLSCDPVGHSGFNDRSTATLKRQCMSHVRAVARRVTPWWWI